MGLVNTLLPFFKTVVVSVIVESKVCKVYIEIVKNKKVINTYKKEFKVFDGELTKDVAKYINRFQSKYKFTYVGTLLNSLNQGSIKGCNKSDFKKYGVIHSDVDSVAINKKWSVYGFSSDIRTIKENFNKDIGVDFIFSPFILLYKYFYNRFDSKAKLYILYTNTSVTMGIFKNKNFIFGAYFSSENSGDTFDSEPSKAKDESNGDDLDDELVFFEEDEDVISLDDDVSSNSDDEPESNDVSSMEGFNDGVNLKNFIKSAIEEFYKNDKYDKEFIDNIIIANAYNLTNDVVSYIEGELMLKIDVSDINIEKTLAKIIKEEVSS